MEPNKTDVALGTVDILASEKFVHFFIFLFLLIMSLDYTLTNHLNKTHGGWFYVIPILMVTQSLILLSPFIKKPAWLSSDSYTALALLHIEVGILFVFFISLASPYVFLLAAIMFVAVYYRGLNGFALSLITQLSIIALTLFFINQAVDYDYLYTPFIALLLSIAFAGVVWRFSKADNDLQKNTKLLTSRVELERGRLLSLINGMLDSVISTDPDGVILLHNNAVTRLLAIQTDILGKSIFDYLHLYDTGGRPVNIFDLIRKSNGRLSRTDLFTVLKDNQRINLDLHVSAVNTVEGTKQRGFTWVMRDITKEKNFDEQRTEFIAVVSHEIRTPLAIAEASISTAIRDVDPAITEKSRALLNVAHDNVTFLGQIVNDLTTLNKIESHKIEYVITPLSPKNLIEKLVAKNQINADKKHISVQVLPDTTVRELITSGMHLEEILQNLITNAIKYTNDNGTVKIGAQNSEKGVLFSVADNGIGISESDKAKLFTKFFRSEDYKTKHTKGTGLGLYISLRLAEKINGKLWFTSELNKGSVFYLEVPSIIESAEVHSKIQNTEAEEFASGL